MSNKTKANEAYTQGKRRRNRTFSGKYAVHVNKYIWVEHDKLCSCFGTVVY